MLTPDNYFLNLKQFVVITDPHLVAEVLCTKAGGAGSNWEKPVHEIHGDLDQVISPVNDYVIRLSLSDHSQSKESFIFTQSNLVPKLFTSFLVMLDRNSEGRASLGPGILAVGTCSIREFYWTYRT